MTREGIPNAFFAVQQDLGVVAERPEIPLILRGTGLSSSSYHRREHYTIRSNGHGGVVVQTEGFTASSYQLRILYLQSHGFLDREICKELGVTIDTLKYQLLSLRERNADLTGMWANVRVLTVRAWQRGLLFPHTIIALEAYEEQLNRKSPH